MSAEDDILGKKKTGSLEMDTHTLVKKSHLNNHYGKPHTMNSCKDDIKFWEDELMANDLVEVIEESQSIDTVKASKSHNSII